MLRSSRSLNAFPFNVILPLTESIRRARASMSVDLPDPLGPMTARSSPSRASPEIPPNNFNGFGNGCVEFPGNTARLNRCHCESFLHTTFEELFFVSAGCCVFQGSVTLFQLFPARYFGLSRRLLFCHGC